MKKYTFVFALFVIMTLTACGSESTTNDQTDSTTNQTDPTEEAPVITEESPVITEDEDAKMVENPTTESIQ
jgi:ABC-type enterochelin transport system substrate-binding protein